MIATSSELEQLIDSTVTIPTIPTTLMAINEVVNSEDGSARDASSILEKDAALAAKMLRLVNSPYYGLKKPVGSIQLACSILGLSVIRNVVVQATVIESCATDASLPGLDAQWLWDHSFKTAMAARLLATEAPEEYAMPKEEAYTCGLMHDIGKMLMLGAKAEGFADAVTQSRGERVPLAITEADLLGFNHAQVGGLLARRWKLPVGVQEAVVYHHGDGDGPEEWPRGFLVHCANTIAHQATQTAGGYHGHCADDDALKKLGVPAEGLDRIRDAVREAGIDG